MSERRTLLWIRVSIIVLMLGLVVSGVTAFPLRLELSFASDLLHASPAASWFPDAVWWVDRVAGALTEVEARHPFISYGTDWLAFAHLVIAVVFIGPLIDPVRNIWVIQFGAIACLGVVPLALIAGGIRGIPLGWQLFDISFGVIGVIPVIVAWTLTRRLERMRDAAPIASPSGAAVLPTDS